MERILEAGAYSNRIDLEKKILEKPIIDVLPPKDVRKNKHPGIEEKIVAYMDAKIITQHTKPIILDLQTLTELTQKENNLDKELSKNYEIFESAFKQKIIRCGLRFQNIIYTQKKYYLLRPEEDARLSHLEINLEVRHQENEFHNLYIEAAINGILAQEKSSLAKHLVNYWKQNNLLIINNVILEGKEEQIVKYSKGSIKCKGVEHYYNELLKEDEIEAGYKQTIANYPKSLKELFLNKDFKKTVIGLSLSIFPVEVIEE